jgi:hypothetical protein
MALVVRCPGCRGASQVDAAARGFTVQCPLCGETFIALPEAALVSSRRPERKTNKQVSTRSREEPESQQSLETDRQRPTIEDDHDPHRHPPGGLPASVLMGLALLPLAIPVLWMIVPVLFGHTPLLSVAVPLAIAASASILSLAVIYTIDWSPQVRVKGVLILVGLAYFFAVSLYFLKPEMVEWVKTFFGHPKRWIHFSHPSAPRIHGVLLPDLPQKSDEQPVPGMNLDCYKLIHIDPTGKYEFVVAVDMPPPQKAKGGDTELGSDTWYDSTIDRIVASVGGHRDPEVPEAKLSEPAGRGVGIKLPDDKTIRIVRLYVDRGRVYYLSIEGADLTSEDEYVRKFFNSFHFINLKK